MNHDAVLEDLAARIPGRADARVRALWLVLLGAGLVSFALLLLTQPARAWAAYGVNMVFFLGVSLGAAALAGAIRLSNGRWAAPVLRIAESLSAYVPYGLLFVLVMLVAGIWTYLPWTRGLLQPRQHAFLNVPFLYARTLAGFGQLFPQAGVLSGELCHRLFARLALPECCPSSSDPVANISLWNRQPPAGLFLG